MTSYGKSVGGQWRLNFRVVEMNNLSIFFDHINLTNM